jgi:hypothetical protein
MSDLPWVNLAAMRFTKHIQLFTVVAVFALLNACNEPRNFDDEIHAIDSLHIAMDNTVQLLDSGSLQITDSITRQLKYIQTNFRGEMKQSMAEALLRYGDYRKKVATLEQWKDSLHYRKDQLENELYAFRNTLADRSTHDRLNREINELYADTVLQNLIGKQQQWHAKINEWMQQQKTVHETWTLLNDTILNWKLAIPQQKQP